MTGDQFSEVDFDLLADYVGGALAGNPDEATVARRIAGEPAWRAAYDELSGAMATVGSQLSAFGAAAEPIPAEVAARIDAALTSAPPVLTVVRGGASEKPRRRRRWAVPVGVAAAVVVFAGVGGGYLVNRGQRATDSGVASSAAGSAEDKSAPLRAPSVALPDPGRIRSSGTDYEAETLGRALPQPLRKGETAPMEGSSSPAPGLAAPLARLRSSTALKDCLAAIAAANGQGPLTVESVDYARYAGKPALVVVFTAANGRFAWASGPDCGASGVGADRLAAVPVG